MMIISSKLRTKTQELHRTRRLSRKPRGMALKNRKLWLRQLVTQLFRLQQPLA